MRTWSLEKTVGRLSDSVWSVVDVLGTVVYDACTLLGALTMPRDPVVDGAEQLAEREAEEEVAEPYSCRACGATDHLQVGGVWPETIIRCFNCETTSTVHEHPQGWQHIVGGKVHCGGAPEECACDIPNPYEPVLTDDELVAVRGLIQERYDSPAASAGGPSEVDSGNPPATNPSEGHSPISFVDWAVPAIRDAVANHEPMGNLARPGFYCGEIDGTLHGSYQDMSDWLDHVVPLIAERLGRALQSSEHFQLNRIDITPEGYAEPLTPSVFDIAEWTSDAARFVGGLPQDVAGKVAASVALRVVDAIKQQQPPT